MSYDELKREVGHAAADRLENAVLMALAEARGAGPPSEAALRRMLVALVGAVIWSCGENHSMVDELLRQCALDLECALDALRADRAELAGDKAGPKTGTKTGRAS